MRWEYLIEQLSFQGTSGGSLIDEAQEILDDVGGAGWEAVAAWAAPAPNPSNKFYILFKRPETK